MLKRVSIITLTVFTLITGISQAPVHAFFDPLSIAIAGSLFKSSNKIKPIATYNSNEFFNMVADLLWTNPAKYDATVKGQGFIIEGEVEKITRLELKNQQSYNQSNGSGKNIYYAVKLKGSTSFAIFDEKRAAEVANLAIGKPISIVGRADGIMTNNVLQVSFFDSRMATDKDREKLNTAKDKK